MIDGELLDFQILTVQETMEHLQLECEGLKIPEQQQDELYVNMCIHLLCSAFSLIRKKDEEKFWNHLHAAGTRYKEMVKGGNWLELEMPTKKENE